ncbi:hypothetical protein Ancab_018687 [Ancistrocladus abbreviatus]
MRSINTKDIMDAESGKLSLWFERVGPWSKTDIRVVSGGWSDTSNTYQTPNHSNSLSYVTDSVPFVREVRSKRPSMVDIGIEDEKLDVRFGESGNMVKALLNLNLHAT